MAYDKIYFENPRTGENREAPVGFSWTVFFFGCFPSLFRSDWKWFFIQFLIAICTFGVSGLIFPFIYNKIYIKELIRKGYKAKSATNGNMAGVISRLKINIPVFTKAENEL